MRNSGLVRLLFFACLLQGSCRHSQWKSSDQRAIGERADSAGHQIVIVPNEDYRVVYESLASLYKQQYQAAKQAYEHRKLAASRPGADTIDVGEEPVLTISRDKDSINTASPENGNVFSWADPEGGSCHYIIPFVNSWVIGDLNGDLKLDYVITTLNLCQSNCFECMQIFIFCTGRHGLALCQRTSARELSKCTTPDGGSGFSYFVPNLIRNQQLVGTTSCYQDGDGHCCPSLECETVYTFDNGLRFHSNRFLRYTPVQQ